MNPKVDAYITRSKMWPAQIAELRAILLGCGLTEELKWGKPCYTREGRNIAIVQEMKDFLALMFFKGALLDDPHTILEEQGPNSRSARRVRFTCSDDIARVAEILPAYIGEAIAVEEAGREVGPAPEPVMVAELRERLDRDPALKAAFAALTPGRRREYNLHFGDATQAATRAKRVDRYAPNILAGKGLRDR